MTYRPGPAEAHRRHRPAASARLRGRRQRRVRPLRGGDLARPARGSEPRHPGRGGAGAAQERAPMTARAFWTTTPGARIFGVLATLAVIALVEAADPRRADQRVHRAAAVAGDRSRSRASSPRRTCCTGSGRRRRRCCAASLLLAAIGVGARHAALPVPRCCAARARRGWARSPSAPIVLMYPLFLVIFGRSATTIVMIGFAAGLRAGDPEDARGPGRHAPGADRRRAQRSS